MPTGRKPRRLALFLLLVLVAVAALAAFALHGARRGAGGDAVDPAWSEDERAVARQALATWRLEAREVGGPLRRLAVEDRVTDLDRRPGSCATPVPGAFPTPAPYDYHATVRAYSLLGIPVASARFSCGGLAWESR